jgi:hypothetical protein
MKTKILMILAAISVLAFSAETANTIIAPTNGVKLNISSVGIYALAASGGGHYVRS